MHEDEVIHISQALIQSLKVPKAEKCQIKVLDSLTYGINCVLAKQCTIS